MVLALGLAWPAVARQDTDPQPVDLQPATSPSGNVPDEAAGDASSPDVSDASPPDVSKEAAARQAGPAAEGQSTTDACEPNEGMPKTLLERVRRGLSITACASSAWLDGLFGDDLQSVGQYRDTYGMVSVGGLWSEYDGFDPRLRFRVHLHLPQWDERISAFVGRVGEDNFISDTESDFAALPTRQFGNLEDESVLVGLGYSNPKRTGNDFDVGVGVRVDLPLDPYVRARYEVVRTFAQHYVLSARESVFWRNTEGFGTTTRVNLDRALNDQFLLRWGSLGKFTEETNGMEWYSQLTLFQSVGNRTGLAWQIQVEGVTDNEVPLTRYSGRLIMRRQLTPEWLVLELRGGMEWPRHRLTESRTMSPEIGIALDMKFGRERPSPQHD